MKTETKLPDGGRLTDSRQYVIDSGYDHYWRFHRNEKEWAKAGCPICKLKQDES